MPLLTIFELYHGYLVLLAEYTKKTTDLLQQVWQTLSHNVVSSIKGVLIADIYISTTVDINLKNHHHPPPGGYK